MATKSDIWTATMRNIAVKGSKAQCNISVAVPSSNFGDTGSLIKLDLGYVLQIYDKGTILAAEAIGDIAVLLYLKV
jgi:hypothetical protein